MIETSHSARGVWEAGVPGSTTWWLCEPGHITNISELQFLLL